MKTRRSNSYVFTADVNSANDMQSIDAVKRTAKAFSILTGKKHRVVLKGRLGKNNPYYEDYYKNKRYYHIKSSHATRFDVYCYVS